MPIRKAVCNVNVMPNNAACYLNLLVISMYIKDYFKLNYM